MKPRIVAIWGHVDVRFRPQDRRNCRRTGLPRAWISACPIPRQGGKIGGGVFAASPPIIYKNLIITTAASGFLPPPAQPADPHANDLRTGKLVWTARLIPGRGRAGRRFLGAGYAKCRGQRRLGHSGAG